MNISTAATISQRCSRHITSTHKASPTMQELTVSKAAHRGIDNAKSNNLNTLREIPTRISQPLATAAAVVLHDDNDARYKHQTPSSLSTVKETKNSSQRTSPSNAVEFFDEELDAIIARCNSWRQQRRPTLIASSDANGTAHTPQLTSPPDTSSPRSSMTLASEDATDPLLKNSQRLLDNMQQRSQALSNLAATSDELVAVMTLLANVVDNLFSAQPPNIVLAPSPNLMATTKSTIISTPALVHEIIKSPLPPTPQPDTSHPCNGPSPWPPPPAPFQKPAPKLKPLVHKKRIKVKPSFVSGRSGPSRTKDCLRPP